MSANKFEIEDLLLDESFINYCKHSSPEDVAYWEEFLENNPADAALVQHAKDVFFQLFNALANEDLEEQVARLSDKITPSSGATVIRMENQVQKQWTKIFSSRLRVAAVAILLVCIGGGLFYQLTNSRHDDFKIYEAAYGERKNIQLRDGSLVTLNSGSSIKIKDDFGITSRDICLRGEAYFDVKHNSKLPFIVHTKAMDIKAVGTAFNIKAYRNEGITETSLIKGIVEVTLKEDQNLKMLLYPNEKIKWKSIAENSMDAGSTATVKKAVAVTESNRNKLKEKIAIANDGVIREIAWKANKLVFEDERFDEIAILLERWYAVKINFNDNSIRNYRFTGIFEKEELNTVLDFLKESRGFNYSIENGESITVNLSK